MSERPTPETDAELRRIKINPAIFVANECTVMADFARKLERQRDEARELVRELRNAMQSIKPWIGYPSTPDVIELKFSAALEKAKEVLP